MGHHIIKIAPAKRAMLCRVKSLIERLVPDPICDECIANSLALPDLKLVHHYTCELAGSYIFERQEASCALCRISQRVIRRKSN